MAVGYITISEDQWRSIVSKAPAVAVNDPLAQRSETRWELQTGTFELCYHDNFNVIQTVSGLIQNVSDQGLMIRAQGEIACNTPVLMRLELEDELTMLCGIVRHCSMSVGSYKIGVRLLFDDDAVLQFG
jgi:hypothetical protein